MSAAIEHGREFSDVEKEIQVLGLRLFTNRGRGLVARALRNQPFTKSMKKGITRDGYDYVDINVLYVDMPFNSGTIKGFFRRSDDGPGGKIYRLGLIWCHLPELKVDEQEAPFNNKADLAMADDEDRTQLEEDRRNAAVERDKALAAAQEVSSNNFKS